MLIIANSNENAKIHSELFLILTPAILLDADVRKDTRAKIRAHPANLEHIKISSVKPHATRVSEERTKICKVRLAAHNARLAHLQQCHHLAHWQIVSAMLDFPEPMEARAQHVLLANTVPSRAPPRASHALPGSFPLQVGLMSVKIVYQILYQISPDVFAMQDTSPQLRDV